MFDPTPDPIERLAAELSRCKICRRELAHNEGWCTQICDGCLLDIKQDEDDRAAELEAEDRAADEYAAEESYG